MSIDVCRNCIHSEDCDDHRETHERNMTVDCCGDQEIYEGRKEEKC